MVVDSIVCNPRNRHYSNKSRKNRWSGEVSENRWESVNDVRVARLGVIPCSIPRVISADGNSDG